MFLKQVQACNKLTTQEQAIVDYILENPILIMNMQAKELAANTYTSSPTVVRLCKKLGYSGYPNFQKSFIKEYYTRSNYETYSNSKTISSMYNFIIQETEQMINQVKLNQIVKLMASVKKIDFYASDINFPKVQSMCLNLNMFGILAQAFDALNETYIKQLDTSSCLSFVISHSGNNPTMIKTAYYLRKTGINTIAITGNVNHNLELICNESLFIYATSGILAPLQRSISLNFLLDSLFIKLLEVKEKL